MAEITDPGEPTPGRPPLKDNYTEYMIESIKRDIRRGEELVPGLYPKEFYGQHYPLSNSHLRNK